MKKIYALLFVSLLLFIGYSCEDGSLSHGDVYIPDPVEESDEDDGFATEPTTTSVVRMSIGEGHQHQMIDGFGCGFAEWSHRIWNNNGSSSNLVVISFLFQLSSSFLILLKVVDMFAF